MTAFRRFILFQFLFITSIVTAQSSFHMSLNTNNGGTVDLVTSRDSNIIILGDNCIPAVVKMDYLGNILWSLQYSTEDLSINGRFIIELKDTGIVFLVSNYDEAYLLKLDPDGQVIWTKNINPIFKTAVALPDGGFLLAGASKFLKMDPQGNIIWQKSIAASGTNIKQIILNSAGNYIFCGTYLNDMLVCKTDTNGVMVWAKSFGGTESDYGYSIVETTDSGYLLGGTFRFPGSVNNHLAILKLYASGDLDWSKLYEGPETALIDQLKINASGNLYAIGDADANTLYMKMDQSGNIDWAKTTDGTGYSTGSSFDFIENEKIFMGVVSGFAIAKLEANGDGFCDYKDINLQAVNINLTQVDKQFITTNTTYTTQDVLAPLDYDYIFQPDFLCKNGEPVIDPIIFEPEVDFSIFPNPFFDHLYVQRPKYLSVFLNMYDSQGRLVYSTANFETYVYEIIIAAGVYHYTLSSTVDGSILHSGKLVKL